MAEDLVRLRNVVKRYGGQTVLEIEELSFRQNECVVLMGANGSGKSTLLRLIAGIAREDAGEVVRERFLTDARVGYVPQSGGLYADLTIEDNLRLRRRLFGFADRWPSELAGRVEALGLSRSLQRKRFGELSGGYQRLASAAAALALEPQWLLFDEPFTGMDEEKRELLVAALDRIRNDMLLLVITSPSREDLPFSFREIVLEDGKLS